MVVRKPQGQFPASKKPRAKRQERSIQKPVANPVSTPAADQPSTMSGYTQRTLMRSTRKPVAKAPIAKARENARFEQAVLEVVQIEVALDAPANWFSAMRSI